MKKKNKKHKKKKGPLNTGRKLRGNCRICRFHEDGKCGLKSNELTKEEKKAHTCIYFYEKPKTQ